MGPREQGFHQRGRIARLIPDSVAVILEQMYDRHRRRGCIEADAIGNSTIPVRIVRKDQSDPAFPGRSMPKPNPVCGQPRNEVDAVPARLVCGDRAFRRLVEIRLVLE